MKILLFAALFFGAAFQARAQSVKSSDFEALRPLVQLIKGVQMTMIALCDPATGLAAARDSDPAKGELCLLASLENQAQLDRVKTVFDLPLRVDGKLVGFEVIGPLHGIEAQ